MRPMQVKHRDFPIFVLNDSYKNLAQRAEVISDWRRAGGVLMMGYELYRQLANRKSKKKRRGRGEVGGGGDEEGGGDRSVMNGNQLSTVILDKISTT